jgi:hypothetical protein
MILADLVAAGYVRRGRTGHRTTYTVDLALPFRHPIEADHTVAELVSLFASPSAWQASRAG